MARKLQRSPACQATWPTRAPPWPDRASVSRSSVCDHLPASRSTLPLESTVHVKDPSSPTFKRMTVSFVGRAAQSPGSLPGLTGAEADAGGGDALGVSGSESGLENCLTSWAESVSWGDRAATCLSWATAASVLPWVR